jgi:hypothetical protein
MTPQHKLLSEYLINFEEKTKDYHPQLKQDSTFNSIIIENRIVINFEQILKNHIYFLNRNNKDVKWGLQIFHSEGNEKFIRNIVNDWDNIILTKIDIEDIDKKTHTELLKSLEFWELVEGETILNFQIDSLLLRELSDDFLIYDFIGAPWSKAKEGKLIGNGGLSIRKKSKTIDYLKKYEIEEDVWEDIFFVKHKQDNELPDILTAMRFSVEDIFYPYPVGLHNPIKIPVSLLKLILDKSLTSIE